MHHSDIKAVIKMNRDHKSIITEKGQTSRVYKIIDFFKII